MTKRLSLVPLVLLFGVILSSPAEDTTVTNASPAVALPSSAPTPTVPDATAVNPASTRPTIYTVVAGDTLWSLSHKFDTSIRAIKKLNKLKKDHLKPGQVLKIPPVRTKAAAKTTADDAIAKPDHLSKADKLAKPASTTMIAKTKMSRTHHRTLLVAQPMQDFDIPPSTFASCPTPPSNGFDDSLTVPAATAPAPYIEPAYVAPALQPAPGLRALPPLAKSDKRPTALASAPPAPSPAAMLVAPAPVKKNFANALADFFGGSHAETSASGVWGDRFLSETRDLASHGIAYDQSWRPEGETHSWAMDCSNTTRYLYQVTAGIQLPRTASDQYYYLHLQDKAWDVPTVASGYADCNFLRSNLKPGDLLFWENTYRPDRQPPITHVMIFLGTNAKGQWIMAGSQSSHGGEFNPRRSGPDVYVFDPTHSSGGYTTWLGLVHHKGRFCAYGRPLEADVKKLSIADND